MPEHATYIETHLGGGAVMRKKRPSPRQIGIDVDQRVIASWKRLPAPCELVCGDAVEFLLRFPFRGDELVYCDPPYPRQVRIALRSYRFEYRDNDHVRLIEVLRSLPCSVMISGGPAPFYLERLADWRRLEFRAGARRVGRAEFLWMNFEAPSRLHDPRHGGENFRERERLKRRMATMTRRVELMPDTERAVFGAWFAERFPEDVRPPAEPAR